MSFTPTIFSRFLRASPGAASPLRSIAIRLTEHMGVLGGVLLTLYARGSLFWRHQASDIAYMVPDWAQFGHQIEV